MLRYLATIMIVFLLACGDNDNTNTGIITETHTVHNQAKNTFDTTASIIDLNGCYEMTIKQDTASLILSMKDSIVTGKLVYDWSQKDGNVGTLKGVLRGDLIFAEYTFESEGTTSVQEIIFRLEDSLLQQAVGDLAQKDNKIVYKNPQDLDFNTMPPYMKIPCSSKN